MADEPSDGAPPAAPADAPVLQAAPAPPATTAELAPDSADSIERGVRAWLDANIRNSIVARDVATWNHLTATLPLLVDAIRKEL